MNEAGMTDDFAPIPPVVFAVRELTRQESVSERLARVEALVADLRATVTDVLVNIQRLPPRSTP